MGKQGNSGNDTSNEGNLPDLPALPDLPTGYRIYGENGVTTNQRHTKKTKEYNKILSDLNQTFSGKIPKPELKAVNVV